MVLACECSRSDETGATTRTTGRCCLSVVVRGARNRSRDRLLSRAHANGPRRARQGHLGEREAGVPVQLRNDAGDGHEPTRLAVRYRLHHALQRQGDWRQNKTMVIIQ